MYSQQKPYSEINTLDLYFVIKSNNNRVDLEKVILDVDKNGNIVPAQVISEVPVFTFKSGKTLIQFEVKEGDIGIYFNTKKYINNYLFNNKNRINPKITKFDKSSGFFIPIGMFNDFDGEGININTNKLKAQIDNIDIKSDSLKAKIDDIDIEGDSNIKGTINQKGSFTSNGTITGASIVSEDGLTQSITVMDLNTSSPVPLNIVRGIVKQ